MKTKLRSMHRWLKRHDYKISRAGICWCVSDPLDGPQGFRVRGSYSQVITEAYNHLRT